MQTIDSNSDYSICTLHWYISIPLLLLCVYVCMCVCACACVHAHVRAHLRVHARVHAWHICSVWCLNGMRVCMISCTRYVTGCECFRRKCNLWQKKRIRATESLKKLSKVDIARPSSTLLNSAGPNNGQARRLNVLLYYLYLFFESLIFKWADRNISLIMTLK